MRCICTGQQFLKQLIGSCAQRCRKCKVCPQDDVTVIVQKMPSWGPRKLTVLVQSETVRPSGFQPLD